MSTRDEFIAAPDPATAPDHPQFNAFVQTIAALRNPNGGCPWDLKQTHRSIARNMIEEAYEAVAAIEEGDLEHMREELGDVLLQAVLQAQIAQDAGEFTIDDVAADVSNKIVRRHPHVFGPQASFAAAGLSPEQAAELTAELEAKEDRSPEEVLELWDVIKLHERKQKEAKRAQKLEAAGLDATLPRGLLEDVSNQQPALMYAQEVSRKTVGVGFEWESTDDVWNKVFEEIAEFKAAAPGSAEAQVEFGDILFALVNVARREHIDAETALRMSNQKFAQRWAHMERTAWEGGQRIEELGTEALEELWKQAKEQLG